LHINVQMVASNIGRRSMELDIVPGRSPISVAAASIYMASHASDSEKKLTKKEISDVAGVADVTIRQSYELMYPRAAELFPEGFKLILSQLPQR
jgi:transcription initiation factor TFIIB